MIRRKKRAAKPTRTAKSNGKARSKSEVWNLRLYIAGQTTKSIAAIANLKRICEGYKPIRFKVDVIDLMQKPHLARHDQIVAIPTLIRDVPVPIKRIIGDLSATERVLVGLDLIPPKA